MSILATSIEAVFSSSTNKTQAIPTSPFLRLSVCSGFAKASVPWAESSCIQWSESLKIMLRIVLKKIQWLFFGDGAVLKSQAAKHSLVEEHDGAKIFNLRPDLMVFKGKRAAIVMDTKWKLIDASDRRNKYGISQADMYQLYAYGHKYLKDNEHKKLMLIYPKTDKFFEPLPVFNYEYGFELEVVPFDLEADRLVL